MPTRLGGQSDATAIGFRCNAEGAGSHRDSCHGGIHAFVSLGCPLPKEFSFSALCCVPCSGHPLKLRVQYQLGKEQVGRLASLRCILIKLGRAAS